MATCDKREIVQPTPPVEYVLTLNGREALALRRLLATCLWPDGFTAECADVYSVLAREVLR